MRLERVRSPSGISVIVGTWRRYSWRAVSRPAKPSCQPSIIASANAHPHDVAQVTSVRTRHDNRCARLGPHSTAAIPIAVAAMLPQPTWAFHQPKIGAALAKSWIACGLLRINGVTTPKRRCGTTKAAMTKATPSATATVSRRPIFTTTRLWSSVLARATTIAPSCRRLLRLCARVVSVGVAVRVGLVPAAPGDGEPGGVRQRAETVHGGHQQQPARKEGLLVLPGGREVARLSLSDDSGKEQQQRQPRRQGRDTEIIQRRHPRRPRCGPCPSNPHDGEGSRDGAVGERVERKQDQVVSDDRGQKPDRD